jgi:hypothetical protein
MTPRAAPGAGPASTASSASRLADDEVLGSATADPADGHDTGDGRHSRMTGTFTRFPCTVCTGTGFSASGTSGFGAAVAATAGSKPATSGIAIAATATEQTSHRGISHLGIRLLPDHTLREPDMTVPSAATGLSGWRNR